MNRIPDTSKAISQPAEYWRRVMRVFSGAAIAQGIPILGSVWLARLYDPSAFGIYGAWHGVTLIINLLLTLRLEAAFGLANDGKERGQLVVVTTTSIVLLGMSLTIFGMIVYSILPEGLSQFSSGLVALLAPMGVCAALSVVWQAWAANNGQIGVLNLIRILQAGSITGFQIIAAWVNPSAAALALSHMLGTAVAVTYGCLALPIWKFIPSDLRSAIAMQRRLWRRYRRFPLYSLPSDIINSTAAQIPVIVLASRYGAEIAGYFTLALRALGAPLAVLGAAVRDVFIRDAGMEMRNVGNCSRVYSRTFMVLLPFSLILIVSTVSFGESLFVIVFGERWRLSGVMAIWLIPLFALRFIAGPLSYTLYLAQRQDVDLWWQISLLAIVSALFYFVSGYRTVLVSYSLSYAAMYVVYLFLSRRYAVGEHAVLK